ncbi:MAG: tetratricopeptide repeat protein [Thermodesulfobacteriota bacterium]
MNKEKILDLAQKYILKGQPKKAIKEYLKLIEADPKDKRIHLKLGDLYYKNGETDKALIEYIKLGDLYAEEDLNFRAIAIYKKALSIDSKHIEALKKIASLYLKEGLKGDAKNYYQTILDIKPGDSDALRALQEFEPSILEEVHKKGPSPPEPFIPEISPSVSFKSVEGRSNLYPSSTAKIQTPSKEMELRAPDKDAEMHYHLGIAYKEMELYDYAISEFELASTDPVIEFDCYIMLGHCYMEKGDYSRSIGYFQKATQAKGLSKEKLARLYYSLGLAYEANGMVSEATGSFQLASQLDQSFSEAREKITKLQNK